MKPRKVLLIGWDAADWKAIDPLMDAGLMPNLERLVHGAGLLDITPTLLALFGLPIADDMDGRPLLDVFESPPQLAVVPSWDEVEGACGMHPRNHAADALADMDRGALQQLVASGYVEDPGGDMQEAGQRNLRENRHYLARTYVDGGRHADAVVLLEELFLVAPDQLRYGLLLAQCQLYQGQVAAARATLQTACEAREMAHDAAPRRSTDTVHQQDGPDAPSPAPPGPYRKEQTLPLRETSVLLAEQRTDEAIAILERMAPSTASGERVLLRLGNALLKTAQWQRALEVFVKALAYAPPKRTRPMSVRASPCCAWAPRNVRPGTCYRPSAYSSTGPRRTTIWVRPMANWATMLKRPKPTRCD